MSTQHSISVRGETRVVLATEAKRRGVSVPVLLDSLPLPTPEQVERIRADAAERGAIPKLNVRAVQREIRAGDKSFARIAADHLITEEHVKRIAKRAGLPDRWRT